jgi:hypothetical protein
MKRGLCAPLTKGSGFCLLAAGLGFLLKGVVVSTAQREKERQGGEVCKGRGGLAI